MRNDNLSTGQRPFSLSVYLLVVFGLSWPFQIVSAIWAKGMYSRFFLNAASMVMVTVGTYIAGRYIFRDGFANAGWRWGKPKHYLWVLGLVVLLWIFPAAVRLAMGTVEPATLSTTETIWVYALPFLILIPGFGEEFGWRGYMLSRMARYRTARKAVAWHAVIWWAWHLPILIGTGVQVGQVGAEDAGISVGVSIAVSVIAVVAVGAIPSMLHAVVFAYIWLRSQSLAVATVYHAAYDGVRDGLGISVGIAPMAGLWANLVLSILGIAFLWKGDWSQLEEMSAEQQATPDGVVEMAV